MKDSGLRPDELDNYDPTNPYYTNRDPRFLSLIHILALKCKIWQFAASPLFNDVNGYAGGNSEAEQQRLDVYKRQAKGGNAEEIWVLGSGEYDLSLIHI